MGEKDLEPQPSLQKQAKVPLLVENSAYSDGATGYEAGAYYEEAASLAARQLIIIPL
jgi:hypothetical protein